MAKLTTKRKAAKGAAAQPLAAALVQQRELRRARDLQRRIRLLARQLRGAMKAADAARAAAADALCDGSDYGVFEIALMRRINEDNDSLRKQLDEAKRREVLLNADLKTARAERDARRVAVAQVDEQPTSAGGR